MAQPKVSIIVPVYNVEKYLDRCLGSLRNQTLSEIEILLIDDSSQDSSLEICKKAAGEDDRIRVFHKENEGLGKTRNVGLAEATGEYIGFVDSDDFVDVDMFRTLYEKAREHSSDLVISGILFVDGNMFSQKNECIRKDYFEKDTLFETEDDLKKLKMGIVGALPEDADDSKYGMSVCKNLFRNDIIQKNKIRFLSEREMLSEDAVFMIDYISCIQKATGIHEAFYNYCRNEGSISKSYKSDRLKKSLVFMDVVEKRFTKDIAPGEYRIYVDRFWQAMCRVLCSQEILHAEASGMKFSDLKNRLKEICTHELTVRTLKSYPLRKLPVKQSMFAYCIKYRLYYLMKVLVQLRSRG